MNKKKIITICAALIILCGMLFAASKIQNIYKGNTANNETVKTNETDNTANGTNSSGNLSSNKTSSSKSSSLEPKDDKSSAAQSTDRTSSNNSAAGSSAKSAGSSGKTDNKADNKTKSSSNSSDHSGSSSNTKIQGASTNKSDEQSALTIIDEAHGGKIVLKKNIEEDGTVGYLTCKFLDDEHIPYKVKGTSGTLYFSAIDGIQEKKAGQLSGWCYYVKKSGSSSFFKPSVSCGQYKLNKGDSVIWKYLKDAVDN